jgi:DNA polymerase-3 subunit epsilon
MRQVVLDTETTGLDPVRGHRLVEIGCLELWHGVPTGQTYHVYINPRRDVPAEAFAVHGLSQEFLSTHPPFEDHVEGFLKFVGKDQLVIHNAPFDMKFINHELGRLDHPEIPMTQVVDTLRMAKSLFPGAPASLDALCRRFQIDNAHRTYHGALLDATLLADVYIQLLGGRQRHLIQTPPVENLMAGEDSKDRPFVAARAFSPSEQEKKAHQEMLRKLQQPVWSEF